MNRFMQGFNFLGVLVLVGLCALQWQANRQANLQINSLIQIRIEQTAKIDEQNLTIRNQAADLDEFRQRLTLAESLLKETQDKLVAKTALCDRLITGQNQLKAALDTWMAAVAERDLALKHADEVIQKLVTERNQAVEKFNDLAGKYNTLVKNLNTANAK